MNKIPDDVYEKALEIASYFFQPHSAKHTDIILKVCRVIMADREGRWQPIETAPKDGTPILAADDGPFAYVVEWFAAAKAWLGGDDMYCSPTHWMPLPTPPKGGDHEGSD